MDCWFNFLLHPESSEEEALDELTSCNPQHCSLAEDVDSGQRTLTALANPSLFPSKWKHILSYTPIQETEINWGKEWDSFSPYFKEGLAKIPLSDFLPNSQEHVNLLPGPGFGDLSHPTTLLCLKLLAEFAPEQVLIDLGCGSGVLSFAALKWGAKFVYSLDVDPKALEHTLENALFNKLEEQLLISSSLPKPLKVLPTLLAMNMTFGDQKQALKTLSFKPSLWITSGILEEQKDSYLVWAEEQGLKLRSCAVDNGWMAFVFEKNE